jgi:uncharacterized protein (DUF305 family)
MDTKTTLAITLVTGLFFLTACSNGTATDKNNADTTSTSSMKSYTMDRKASMNDTMKTDNELMSSMNNMMTKMDSMQMTGDFDTDFATMMNEHHQGAIDMAQIEVSKGSDEKVKRMAQNIIAKQTVEQGKLKNIVNGYKLGQAKPDSTHAEHRLHDVMINMMDKMKGMQMTGNTDKDFVMMMIPHHQSAVEMSKSELSFGKNSQIKQMAQKGISDQAKEINEFKTWMSSN